MVHIFDRRGAFRVPCQLYAFLERWQNLRNICGVRYVLTFVKGRIRRLRPKAYIFEDPSRATFSGGIKGHKGPF